MASSQFDDFYRRLNSARNGGAVLFCGAGFSADCLNFRPDETLGTGDQLLEMFNSELQMKVPFKDLRNAADALTVRIAEHGMMSLLKEKFSVSNVTTDMVDMVRYPWQCIYTTNYDNAIKFSSVAAKKNLEAISNTEDPDNEGKETPIIHLHGYAEKWDINNFRDSCVLGAESYLKLTNVKRWLGSGPIDLRRAV